MYKIIAPNKKYNGVSHGTPFFKGIAYTDDIQAVEWFRENGYSIEEIDQDSTGKVPSDELKALRKMAKQKGIQGYTKMNIEQLTEALELGKEADPEE